MSLVSEARKNKLELIPGGIQKIIATKASLWGLSFFIDFDSVTWDDKLVGGLDFLANSVLQVPFFLMSLMRYITPTLDHM